MDTIQIEQLRVGFPKEQGTVLHDIHISFKKGSTTALVGESGSGKSVLGKAIAGLLVDAEVTGTIQYKGKNLVESSTKEWESLRGNDIFFMPQDPQASLNPTLTIGEQIGECIELYQTMDGKIVKEQVRDSLCRLGFQDVDRIMKAYPHELSGGMNQRVLCAIAFALKPAWLIADEPTKGLDTMLRKQTAELFMQVKREVGCGIIFITHDMELAAYMSDYVVILQQGRICEEGLAKQVFKEPTSDYGKELLYSQVEFWKREQRS